MNTEQRFLKYVSFPTMSDESSQTVPSSEKQLVFNRYLRDELIELGLCNVELDNKGYLYATLPSNIDTDCVTLGLVAHVDTSDACPDAPINARTVLYNGEDICLNADKNIFLSNLNISDVICRFKSEFSNSSQNSESESTVLS